MHSPRTARVRPGSRAVTGGQRRHPISASAGGGPAASRDRCRRLRRRRGLRRRIQLNRCGRLARCDPLSRCVRLSRCVQLNRRRSLIRGQRRWPSPPPGRRPRRGRRSGLSLPLPGPGPPSARLPHRPRRRPRPHRSPPGTRRRGQAGPRQAGETAAPWSRCWSGSGRPARCRPWSRSPRSTAWPTCRSWSRRNWSPASTPSMWAQAACRTWTTWPHSRACRYRPAGRPGMPARAPMVTGRSSSAPGRPRHRM